MMQGIPYPPAHAQRAAVASAAAVASRSCHPAPYPARPAQRTPPLPLPHACAAGNADGAKIYAQNAIRKKNEALNYLRLGSRLDAVVSRLDQQAKMQVSLGAGVGTDWTVWCTA